MRHPRCVNCGARSVHQHHIISRQLCKRHGLDADSRHNLMYLCMKCHFQHHAAMPRLKYEDLPSGAIAWADSQGYDWLLERGYD